MLQDSLSRLLSDLHGYHVQEYSITQMEAQKAELSNVQLTDINRVIKTYLDPSLFSVSGAGPVNNLKAELQAWHQTV